MKRISLIFLVIFLGGTLLSKADFSSAEWEKLKKGEVVITEVAGQNADGSQRIDFLAKIYVKADRKTVWKHLRDYEKFPEFMPNLVVCKITKKEGDVYWVHYETKVMVVKAAYDMILTGEPYNKIVFKLDKSKQSSIRDTNGYWLLEDAPDNSGTILSYSTYVDTGIPAPEALAKQAAKKSLPNVVQNMKKRIESGGTWKKPEGT